MSVRMGLPGPFSVSLRGLSLRQQIAQDKETIREVREGLHDLHGMLRRSPEPKKIKKLRRETARENRRAAADYRRSGSLR